MHSAASNAGSKVLGKYAAVLVAALIVALVLAVLPGCSQPAPQAQEEKKATASDYMVSLNQNASILSEKLADFATAVEAGDVSAMQAKADAAFAVLDDMANLEAPEELSELRDKYNNAANSLRMALEDYLKLYLEIENSPDGNANYSDYAVRIESVQKEYDEGLNLLEEADKMAAEL